MASTFFNSDNFAGLLPFGKHIRLFGASSTIKMVHSYIGIDIGTTATKAVVFSPVGQVLYQTSREYPMYHPQPTWSIQKPEDLLQAVIDCLQEVNHHFPGASFISFSAAMHSLLLLDEQGKPLTDCLLWADNRAANQAERLRDSAEGPSIYQRTGIPLHTFSPLTKLWWFKEEAPAIFQKAHKFISAKEYVWQHLTGVYQVDTSMASGTGMLNLESLDWDEGILEDLEIRPDQLSEIVPSTYCTKSLDGQYSLVIGAGDGPLASLGTGAIGAGKMALTIGTSGAIRLPVRGPKMDPEMRTQCYHLIDDQYLSLGAVNNGAVILQWLKENVLRSEASYETLFEQASTVPAGSDGLLFVPYLLGERAPIWDANARGCMLGLSIQHRQEHFVRAAMEGIVLGLRHIAEVLLPTEADRANVEICASGGFAKSELWVQIVADVFQMRVILAETVEGSAWGAVLLGCKALGLECKEQVGEEQVFEPNRENAEVYAAAFERFREVYPMLNKLAFRKLSFLA
jgi:gluconokinase